MNESLETIKYISYQFPSPHTYPAEGDGVRVVDDEGVELPRSLPFPRIDNRSLFVFDVHHEVELALTAAFQLKFKRNSAHFRPAGRSHGTRLETWRG